MPDRLRILGIGDAKSRHFARWARRLAEPPVIGALAGRPQFAITADA